MTPLIAALLLAGEAAQEAVPLTLVFEKGQVLRYRTRQEVVIGPSTHLLRDTFRLEVKGVDAEGRAGIEAAFETVAVRASGLQEYDYDSGKHEAPFKDPNRKILSRLVGQKFTFTVAPDGRVGDVRGCDRILDRLMAAAGGEQEVPLARQVVTMMLSDKTMTSRMQEIWMVLPSGKAAPGEAWDRNLPLHLPVLGRIVLQTTSKVESVEGGTATLQHAPRVLPKPEDDIIGQFIKIRKAKGEGRTTFSTARRQILSSALDLSMKLDSGGGELDLELTFRSELLGE